MRVLLAFDKFKDAVSASQACQHAATALRKVHPDWEIDECPLTDGGEGFVEILTRAGGGTLRSFDVIGPRGQRVSSNYGRVKLERLPMGVRKIFGLDQKTLSDRVVSIVEMASASGLALLPTDARDPWQTSTIGTGELLREAAKDSAAILLGIGGSATNDLGLGALIALGYEFIGSDGQTVFNPVPSTWAHLAQIRGKLIENFPPLFVACDVTNPLLGPNGCAAVYGPQKGLKAEDRPRLETLSAKLADLLCAHTHQSPALRDVPGAGAAGGISFGLMAAAGAKLLSGSDLMMDWMELPARIRNADIVITGEGRFDASSVQGKGPGAVIAQAIAAGKNVHVFAGQVTTQLAGASLHPISPLDWTRERALAATPTSLAATIRSVFG